MKLKKVSGFTLIEVLVALTIVAIALGAGVKAAGALGDNATRLHEVTAGQLCAENILVDLRLAHQFPDIGESDYGCDQLGGHYLGHLSVQGTPNPNFRRVDAAVRDADGHTLITLSTIMAKSFH
ncbi:MAG: type II secretion system minor pseudopilin GspI [Pelomonas sp.]|nr:type II secretion system minor pseudopilin GspI [Roseateles sp.]